MQVYVTKIIDPSSDPVFRVEVSETCEIAVIRAEARAGKPFDWDDDVKAIFAADQETGAEYEITRMHVVSE